jgi:hypothetical protein
MRTALILATLIAGTAPAYAQGPCDPATMPPAWARQPPSVTTYVYTDPAWRMAADCHKDAERMTAVLYGCTYQHDSTLTGNAIIILNADLSPADRACVLIYEQAHLPPNSWFDPVMEATAPDDPRYVGQGGPPVRPDSPTVTDIAAMPTDKLFPDQ